MSLGGDIDYATTVVNAFDQFKTGLNHLVKVLADPSLSTLDQTRFIGLMQDIEQTRNQIPLIDHSLIREGESRNLPEALTQPSMIRVLMSVLRLSPGEASRRVRAAAALGERTSMLGQPLPPLRPHLAAAQQNGKVSPEQVSIIERALAQVDRRGFDPADIEAGERILVQHAETLAVTDLRILAAQVIDRIDPDGTRPKDEINHDRRHVEFHRCRDGSWTGTMRLTGALGAKLQAVLGPLAKPRVNLVTSADGRLIEEPDLRHHGQRMHDALEDVCDRLLRSDAAVPDSGGTPATVIITIDVEDLLNGTGYGLTSDGTLIRTDQVRDLVDQADAYYAFLDRNGVPLNLGRTRRIANRSQTAALIARDAGCSFPGCGTAPEWCERHHIIPWIDGGATNLNNLTLLCRYHHHNFTSRGWTGQINPDGIPEWTPPRSVDPPQLHQSPAFAQGMILPAGPTLYVGGQNGTDSEGALLDGLGPQTEQALRNVLAVLAEAGTGPEHVAKLTIYLAAGVDPGAAYAATGSVWGNRRTAVTVLAVTPARPGALVEIEAVAAIPDR